MVAKATRSKSDPKSVDLPALEAEVSAAEVAADVAKGAAKVARAEVKQAKKRWKEARKHAKELRKRAKKLRQQFEEASEATIKRKARADRNEANGGVDGEGEEAKPAGELLPPAQPKAKRRG